MAYNTFREDPFTQSHTETKKQRAPLKLWHGALAGGAVGAAAVLWFDSETWLLNKPFKNAAIAGVVCAGIGTALVAIIRHDEMQAAHHQTHHALRMKPTYSEKIAAERSSITSEPSFPPAR